MAIFNVPVTVQIEAESAFEASELVLSFVEYAQDVGNDDGAVQGCFVASEAEVKDRIGAIQVCERDSDPDQLDRIRDEQNARYNVFTEAMEAQFISTSVSPLEEIRIRRDLVAQEILGGYPQDTVISRELYDADGLLGECLIWMNSHFEFPNWEGRTVGEFLIKHGIPGEPVCMNVLQHNVRQTNNDGIRAENITLQELWDAQVLGDSGWLLPSGLEIWFHKSGTST